MVLLKMQILEFQKMVVRLLSVSNSARRMLGQEDEGSTVLQNVRNALPTDTESYSEELLIAYV